MLGTLTNERLEKVIQDSQNRTNFSEYLNSMCQVMAAASEPKGKKLKKRQDIQLTARLAEEVGIIKQQTNSFQNE